MVPAYLVPSRPERIPNTNDALLIGMKVWRDTEMVGMRLRPTTPAHHTITRPFQRSCHVDLPVKVAPYKEGIDGPVF